MTFLSQSNSLIFSEEQPLYAEKFCKIRSWLRSPGPILQPCFPKRAAAGGCSGATSPCPGTQTPGAAPGRVGGPGRL